MSTPFPTETDFLYVDSDIPPGQTLREWRRERAEARTEARRRTRRRFAVLRPRFA
jgi:hypothetical protein